MELQEFLNHMNSGQKVVGGSREHLCMTRLSQEALRLTAELNGSYHTPEEIREIFAELTGKEVDESFRSFVKRNFLGVGKRARNALVDGLKPVPGGRWYKTLAALEMGI